MNSILQWVYLFNFVFLMMHEYDGAYWKEWRMFGKAGASLSDEKGLTILVLSRIFLIVPILYGLLHLDSLTGLIISLIFSTILIFHFLIHMLTRKQGDKKFAWPISYFVQYGLLTLSIVQIGLTITMF